MRRGVLGSLVLLVGGAGMVLGQPATAPLAAPSPTAAPPTAAPTARGPTIIELPPGVSPDHYLGGKVPYMAGPGPISKRPPYLVPPRGPQDYKYSGPSHHPRSLVWSAPWEFFADREELPPDTHAGKDGMAPGEHLDGHAGAGAPAWSFWFRTEYMMQWIKDGPTPGPLVVSGPGDEAGLIGSAGTSVLYGQDKFDFGGFNGARVGIGLWFTHERTIGIEFAGFITEERSDRFVEASTSTGDPAIARPFFNPLTETTEAFLVSFPGAFSGNIGISAHTQTASLEANLVGNAFYWNEVCVGWLAGFRYLDLDEDIIFLQGTTVLQDGIVEFLGRPVQEGATLTIVDSFVVHNRFFGGQLGATAEYRWGNFTVNLRGLLALGGTRTVVLINGGTVLQGQPSPPPDVRNATSGGFLALTSNIGRTQQSEFAVAPELGLRVGYDCFTWLNIFAGYNLLYWSAVTRPGQEIDLTVNPTLLPTAAALGITEGPPRPARIASHTDFWIQGFTFGFELRY